MFTHVQRDPTHDWGGFYSGAGIRRILEAMVTILMVGILILVSSLIYNSSNKHRRAEPLNPRHLQAGIAPASDRAMYAPSVDRTWKTEGWTSEQGWSLRLLVVVVVGVVVVTGAYPPTSSTQTYSSHIVCTGCPFVVWSVFTLF